VLACMLRRRPDAALGMDKPTLCLGVLSIWSSDHLERSVGMIRVDPEPEHPLPIRRSYSMLTLCWRSGADLRSVSSNQASSPSRLGRAHRTPLRSENRSHP
jgi:hypothetical protein